jgi:hypothetical protein
MRGNKYSKNEFDSLLDSQYSGGDDEGAKGDEEAGKDENMDAKPDITNEEAIELAKKRQEKFNEILKKRKEA